MARITGSDELFRLIHSLTPEEKGYFKKFATRHSGEKNLYLSIFNEIAGQNKFDEALLKKKYKSYAVQKVYLFESIMDSLMIYQRDGAGKYNPHYSVIYFHILYRKGLLDKAAQLTQKTLEWVTAVEWFPMQIQFLEFRLLLEEKGWRLDQRVKQTNEIFAQIKEVRLKEANRDRYSHISYTLYNLELLRANDSGYVADPDQLIDAAFLKNKKNSLSITSDRMRLVSLAKYYDLKNDLKGVCKAFEEHYRFESSFIENRMMTQALYLSLTLRGMLEAYIKTGQISKAKATFEKDWHLAKDNTGDTYYNSIQGIAYDTYENYLYYCQFHSLIYWLAGEYKRGADLIKREAQKINNPALREKHTVAFYDVWKTRILFEYKQNELREAMMTISELENTDVRKVMPMIYKDCQWMKVLVQLQLKNYTIVQSLSSNLLKGKLAEQFSSKEKECLMLLRKTDSVTVKGIFDKIRRITSQDKGQWKIFNLMTLADGLGM